jgi:hypothetical protein
MSIDNYKSQIAAQVANSAVNQLIAELANALVQKDELQAKVADLEAKLSPKPKEGEQSP